LNSTEYYRKRHEQRLCIDCGQAVNNGEWRCTDCERKYRHEKNLDRQYYINIGVCPICKKNGLLGGESACTECRAKKTNATNVKRDINRNDYNTYMRELKYKLYHERKEQGICTYCGKRQAEPGRSKCTYCLARFADKKQAHYETVSQKQERIDNHLCVWCGKPLDRVGKLCTACARKIPSHAPSQNHPWRHNNYGHSKAN